MPASRAKKTKKHARASLQRLEDRRLLANAEFPSPNYMPLYLVSDQANHALIQDSNLVNPWGIGLHISSGDFSIADNGTGVDSFYGGDVNGSPLVASQAVQIPGGSPTGQVAVEGFNNGSSSNNGFTIGSGASAAAADFLFASLSGKVSGYAQSVSATDAQLGAIAANASYTGLAFGYLGQQGPVIYASDFHNGKIDVFNSSFQPVATQGLFTDPSLPAGYAPYNIENLQGELFVAYGKQDASHQFPLPGFGFIDIYDQNGQLLNELATGAPGQGVSFLDAPWGMAIAPASFGRYAGDLLVANTGTGQINAFDYHTVNPQPGSFQGGAYVGTLLDPSSNPLTIDGLRGLSVGNDTTAGGANSVYFTADPGRGAHGLFGALVNVGSNSSPPPSNVSDALVAVGAQFAAPFNSNFTSTVASFSDINGQNTGVAPFAITINWGDGTSSVGSALQVGANQYLVQGSHAYTVTGSYQVSVEVLDSHGNDTIANSIAVVSPESGGGTLNLAAVNGAYTVGAAGTGKVATFTDSDGNTSAGDYTATIDFGDGTATAPGTVSFNAGTFQVAGQHTYSRAGSFPMVVKVSDSDGAAATVTATATVGSGDTLSANPYTFYAAQQSTFRGAVANFSDSNAASTVSEFTATIDWGDGTTTSGSIAPAVGGGFNVIGTHPFAAQGTTTSATVTVKDTAGSSITIQSTGKVVDGTLSLNASPVSATAGSSGTFKVARFTDSAALDPLSDYSATIDWGDGSVSTGTISASGNTLVVAGTHTYANAGRYTLDVMAGEANGSTALAQATATVASAGGSGTSGGTGGGSTGGGGTGGGLSGGGLPGTDSRPYDQWVNSLFEALLGRQADPGALSYFSNLGERGDRVQAVSDIVHSQEYLGKEVNSLYQQYLHRPADDGGLSFFVSQLQNGSSAANVAASLASSQEFYMLEGGDTDSGFLDALFQSALGRPIDPGAQQFFDQMLASGASREQVVAAVVSSPEHLAAIVNGIYQNVLNRPADPSGLLYWVSQLQNGATRNQIFDDIAGSLEYLRMNT